jgi:DNA-binding CsgD family transcriptional regulator
MHAPPGSTSIRGREREWDLILELLGSARRGKSGILLLEGEPGMGKSVLLAAAADAASAQGFSLATSVGEKLSWPHGDARGWLEELGSAGPVLVSIDDLHYAAPVTLHALRTLPGLLSSYPFSWILARSGHDVGDGTGLLFEVLQREGASRIRLPPLSDEAQAALAADVLGAAPDEGLAECTACAGGNPLVLRELLLGLSEEDAILIADGRASLISQRIPDRFRAAMRDRLKRLAVPTRHFLAAGAILGASFRLEDVAEMLGESPASLLAPVEEALAANFVVTSPDAIAFQHDLLWRVVTGELPQHVLEALHRQAGEMLLKRGGSAVPAARHLLAAVRRGDPVVLGALDLAVTEALHSSPRAAAEIAVRTLELTPGTDRERTARTVTAVRALTTAGMWQTAGELAQPALAVPMDARSGAPLRCALASLHAMSDRQAEALIEAESIMADPEVTPGDRDEAKIVLLQALTALRDGQQMEQVATSVLAQQGGTRGEVFVAAQLVRALVAWDAGRVTESLDLAAEAMRNEAGELAHRFQPEVFLASQLIDIGNLTAARAVLMNPPGRLDEPVPVSWCAASPDILRARLALVAGNLDDAAAEAESALVYSDAVGMDLHSLIARSVLAAAALRRGDLHTAVRQMDSSPAPVHHFVSAYEAVRADLVWAQVEEAQHGPGAALVRLARLYETVHKHQYPLMSDPASAPWLVRVALAAGDRRRAEVVTTVMAGLHQRNPAVPVFRACAEHARGVLGADRACLEQAFALHEDPWARASAAEDLGTLLAAAGSRNEAVKVLGESLEGYERTGAERGAARIRRRLRRLGVRRGRWTSVKRPPTGWESLTDTDRSISKLVAEGMTNQQIADQLYISIHTVAYHLRQVFRKLGVRSRVELARIALERTEDGDPVGLDKA